LACSFLFLGLVSPEGQGIKRLGLREVEGRQVQDGGGGEVDGQVPVFG
jgi:hypothetical protein